MKVLAINGSPRGKQSCTFKMLEPLLKGMRNAGAETEIIHLGELNIQHCLGCFACWTKTPGKCVIKDDMAAILEKMIDNVELIIYGTPLYIFSMSGLMKNFMDRCIPLASPFMEESKNVEGVTTHPRRYKNGYNKMLLVSPCGFPEFKHFEPLVFTYKRLADMADIKYLGEILRPTAEALRSEEHQSELAPYFASLELAGQQLIEQEKIADNVMEQLRQTWLTPEEFREHANEYFKKEIAKHSGE
jgi:multimeric flavodoxin WrbA